MKRSEIRDPSGESFRGLTNEQTCCPPFSSTPLPSCLSISHSLSHHPPVPVGHALYKAGSPHNPSGVFMAGVSPHWTCYWIGLFLHRMVSWCTSSSNRCDTHFLHFTLPPPSPFLKCLCFCSCPEKRKKKPGAEVDEAVRSGLVGLSLGSIHLVSFHWCHNGPNIK